MVGDELGEGVRKGEGGEGEMGVEGEGDIGVVNIYFEMD